MKMWRKPVFAAIILIIVGCTGLVIGYNLKPSSTKPSTVVSTTNAKPPTATELLKLVNAERAKYHVAPLKESSILDKSAQWKADDEVKYSYFGHVRPGTTGNDGLDYLNSLNPPCKNISENITENLKNHNTAEQAVYSWIKSPPHHKAMIDPKYSLTGFGIDKNEIVEHFCQP